MKAKKTAPQIKFHPYPRKKKKKVLFKHYPHLLYKDAQILKKIHNKKSDYIYVLASKLSGMVKRWVEDTGVNTLRYHLQELTKEVPHSINTLRQAYYIGRCFPDLVRDPSKRILPHSHYREIAGADNEKVPEIEKIKVRREAEENNYTVKQIRDILHEKYKIGRKDSAERCFVYSWPFLKFAKKLKAFILEHKEIIDGSEIKVRIKFPKKKSSPKSSSFVF